MPLRRAISVALATAGLTLGAGGTAAAAPGADNFADAPPLLFSADGTVASHTFTVQGAFEPDPAVGMVPCVAMSHTAWWRITGTGATIDVSTLGSDFNTVLAVYNSANAPTGSNRVACNNDVGGAGGQTSAASFASTRGSVYLVQVGRLGTTSVPIPPANNSTIHVAAASPARPANDDRIAPTVLPTGISTITSNVAASQELGEAVACAGAPFAATTWLRWTAPATGDALFSTSAGFATAVAAYRADSGALVGCRTGVAATLALRVAGGDYLLQIASAGADAPALPTGPIATTAAFTLDPDADGDGALRSVDCNDADPAIRPGIVDIPDDGIDQDCNGADAVNLDRDGDGSNRPLDCNDADARIHPGARDVPGNRIDENCDGRDAAFPQLSSRIFATWVRRPFRLTSLSVTKVTTGTRISVTCRGRGCPRRSSVRTIRKAAGRVAILSPQLRRARLKRGAVIEIRVTKPGFSGVVRRITVVSTARDPRLSDRCLPPGGRPRIC